MHPSQKVLKSTPKPAWELQAWGIGPASEPVTLPFRQQRAEDQEAPAGTKNMQVTRARGGSTTTTSYCPQNPLDRGLWAQAGMGDFWEEVELCAHRPGPGSPGVSALKWGVFSPGLQDLHRSLKVCSLEIQKRSRPAGRKREGCSRRRWGRQRPWPQGLRRPHRGPRSSRALQLPTQCRQAQVLGLRGEGGDWRPGLAAGFGVRPAGPRHLSAAGAKASPTSFPDTALQTRTCYP